LGPWAGPDRAVGAHDRGARGRRAGAERASRGGACLSLAAGARRMSDFALAVFASETGTHLIRAPSGARWRTHLRTFDAEAYERRLAERGFRFLGRSSPTFPPLLGAMHDPPAGLFLRGAGPP